MSSQPKRPDLRKKTRQIKPTNDEIEARVEAVELLMARNFRRSQIHEAMRKKYDVSWRTCDRYVARARHALLKRLRRDKEDHIADALALYESIIRSGEAKPSEKIAARKRIDELLGLDAPRRTELSGPQGGPIEVDMAYEEALQNDFGSKEASGS